MIYNAPNTNGPIKDVITDAAISSIETPFCCSPKYNLPSLICGFLTVLPKPKYNIFFFIYGPFTFFIL